MVAVLGIHVRSTATVCPMSTSSGHPLRRLLLLALVIGAIVVVRNATADRGGSYDPASDAA